MVTQKRGVQRKKKYKKRRETILFEPKNEGKG